MKKASLDRGSNASETKKQRESLQESNDVMPLWPPPCDEALPEGQNDEDQLVAAVVECLLLEKQQRTERTLQKVSDVCRTTKEIGKELNEEKKRERKNCCLTAVGANKKYLDCTFNIFIDTFFWWLFAVN